MTKEKPKTVRQFIEELQQLDPDRRIMVCDYECYEHYAPVIKSEPYPVNGEGVYLIVEN